MHSIELTAKELGATFGLPADCPVIQLLTKALNRLNHALEAPLPDFSSEAQSDQTKNDWQSALKLQNALLRQTREVLHLIKLWLSLLGKKPQGEGSSPVPVPASEPKTPAVPANVEVTSSALFSLLASKLPGGVNGKATNGLKKLAMQAQRR
ncbi:MAG: hypothetical protein KIT45_03225 [Fimbriimonadia bacterium]|nr:hypothetical protein [Fimbriimonadia bacterium]